MRVGLPSWRSVVATGMALAAVASGAAAGAVFRSAAPDLTGTWKVFNTSGPGAGGTIVITDGTGGRFNGTGYGTFVVKGTVSGNTVHYTVSDATYNSTVDGTLNSSATRITYSWHDSNSQKGTGYLERQGVPPPPTATTKVDLCVPSDCSSLDIKLDPSIDPGQTTVNADVGCATRVTSSADGPLGCVIDAVIDATGSLASPLDPASAKALQEALKSVEGLPGLTTPEHDLIAGLLDDVLHIVQPPLGTPTQGLDGLFEKLQTSPDDAEGAQQVDTELEPAVPPDQGRLPAGIQRSTAIAPRASAVIGSILAAHPSTADVKAYRAAIKLATSTTYSAGRAAARLELLLAEELGGRELIRELAGKAAVIATAKIAVPAKAKHSLTLRATSLGARYLRFLGVKGLSRHGTAVRLRVTSTSGGTRHVVAKLLTVR